MQCIVAEYAHIYNIQTARLRYRTSLSLTLSNTNECTADIHNLTGLALKQHILLILYILLKEVNIIRDNEQAC